MKAAITAFFLACANLCEAQVYEAQTIVRTVIEPRAIYLNGGARAAIDVSR